MKKSVVVNDDSDQSELWGGDKDQDFSGGSVRGNGTADKDACWSGQLSCSTQTVIHTFLHDPDLRTEAVEEIEDSLGIKATRRGEIDGLTWGAALVNIIVMRVRICCSQFHAMEAVVED
jgi:hypothetical protein